MGLRSCLSRRILAGASDADLRNRFCFTRSSTKAMAFPFKPCPLAPAISPRGRRNASFPASEDSLLPGASLQLPGPALPDLEPRHEGQRAARVLAPVATTTAAPPVTIVPRQTMLRRSPRGT